MNTYIAHLWDTLRSSFWFVPTVLGVAAVVGSVLMPALDEQIPEELLSWCATTPQAARSTLSAIAAAMMTVAGTVFSITVVTLSLTSQQFGPRLLRTFMLDFPTQLTIGTFLSTGVYCLLILRVVEDQEGIRVPHLSVTSAVGLSVLSMGLLIYFVHHVAILIQAPQIVVAVAQDLDDSIERLFPERIGQEDQNERAGPAAVDEQRQRLGNDFRLVASRREGYIQAIDASGLMSFAEQSDVCIELLRRPGHYISKGEPLAHVWRGEAVSDEDCSFALNEVLIVGARRTPRQDVECAIEELVEVAVRSLSPGINDPFTAVNCVDHLGSTLGRLAERKIPSELRYDDSGTLRVIARVVTFPDALAAAFNQIRQYGSNSPAVLIRLLEVFESVMSRSLRDKDRSAVLEHADMVLRAAERSFPEKADLAAARERHKRLRRCGPEDK